MRAKNDRFETCSKMPASDAMKQVPKFGLWLVWCVGAGEIPVRLELESVLAAAGILLEDDSWTNDCVN